MSEPEDGQDDAAPGWEAIDGALRKVYGEVEPLHYGTIINYRLGGPDPLDGISVYRCEEPVPHWHFVTYGFSDLYGEQGAGEEGSGYGFELTFRLAREAGDETPPAWALNLLRNLGRYVFESGNVFEHGHHMDLNGPIALGQETQIGAVCFRTDPVLGTIATPSGEVAFLQIVGITLEELKAKKRWQGEPFLEILGTHVPGLVTDLGRSSILEIPGVAERMREGARADGSSTGMLYVSDLRWEERGGWLRKKELTITLGANMARDFGAILAGRIPFGEMLVIAGGKKPVVFEPGDPVSWSDDGTLFHVSLPAAAAREAEEGVPPRAGTWRLPSAPGLIFEVEKSYIRDPHGNMVETIG